MGWLDSDSAGIGCPFIFGVRASVQVRTAMLWHFQAITTSGKTGYIPRIWIWIFDWQLGLWRWKLPLRRGTGIRLGVLCFGAFRGRPTGALHLRHVPTYEMLCLRGWVAFSFGARLGWTSRIIAAVPGSGVHVWGKLFRVGHDPADQSGIWKEFQGQRFGVSILESSGVFRGYSTGTDNSHHK
jgi:hypothetical protein